ncbi:MAG: Type 1 glutamine amidotransferase-like domain-containing protein [Candidatus Aenigmatarchaeota archaeon]
MRMFLAGGGGKDDSYLLDKRFLEEIGDITNPIIYIPVAMEPQRYSRCFDWFCQTFSLPQHKIYMLTDLSLRPECSAVYIGGGDTVRLLRQIKENKFDEYLKELIFNRNVPVYGGSAGAIIFGQNILTAPEARTQNLSIKEAKGLGFLNFSVLCHYNYQPVEIKGLQEILCIPERSGVFINGDFLEVIGYEPSVYLKRKKSIQMPPKSRWKLSEL